MSKIIIFYVENITNFKYPNIDIERYINGGIYIEEYLYGKGYIQIYKQERDINMNEYIYKGIYTRKNTYLEKNTYR